MAYCSKDVITSEESDIIILKKIKTSSLWNMQLIKNTICLEEIKYMQDDTKISIKIM